MILEVNKNQATAILEGLRLHDAMYKNGIANEAILKLKPQIYKQMTSQLSYEKKQESNLRKLPIKG